MIKTKKNKTIYLASPYGFADQWRLKLLPEFLTKLESMGARVNEPFSRNNNIDLSKALQLTKKEFINGKYGEKYKSPAYWASYVIIGK